jgi:hypothetical protein
MFFTNAQPVAIMNAGYWIEGVAYLNTLNPFLYPIGQDFGTDYSSIAGMTFYVLFREFDFEIGS